MPEDTGAIIKAIIFFSVVFVVLAAMTESFVWPAVILGGGFFILFMIKDTPHRRARQAMNEKIAQAEAIKRAELRVKTEKEQVIQRYGEYEERKRLRKEIEKMPKYANWREEVFRKCGRQCEMCGVKSDLQVHHRTPFDKILRVYKITTVAEAFECDFLWSISNGSVLCKKCHDQMESSKTRTSIYDRLN